MRPGGEVTEEAVGEEEGEGEGEGEEWKRMEEGGE